MTCSLWKRYCLRSVGESALQELDVLLLLQLTHAIETAFYSVYVP